jgi:hypothetical protein
MAVGFVQRSFSGGEISVPLSVRVDQPKARYGCKTCRNMMPMRTGALCNRNGFKYIIPTKSNAAARLIPFVFNTGDSYVIELGDTYMRFIRSGAQLQVSGPAAYASGVLYNPGDIVRTGASGSYQHWYCKLSVAGTTPAAGAYWYALTMVNNTDTPTTGGISILEVPSPFVAADLFNVRMVQSGDVITFAHPTYTPYELTRLGATTWTMLAMPVAPPIRAPAGQNADRNGAGNQKYRYKVTSIKKETYEESLVGYAGQQATGTITNGGAGGDLHIAFPSDPVVTAGVTAVMILDAYPTTGTPDEAFEAKVEGVVFLVSVDAPPAIDIQLYNAAGAGVTSAGIVAPAGYAVDVLIFAVTADTVSSGIALSGFNYTAPAITGGGGTKPIAVNDGTHGMVTGDVIFVAAVTTLLSYKPSNLQLAKELAGRTFSITVTDASHYTLDGTEGIDATSVTSHRIHRFQTWVEITGCAVPAKAVTGDGIDAHQHVITIGKVNQAEEYWVYKETNGIYGYLGTMAPSGALGQYQLRDEGQQPDVSKTPPKHRNPLLKTDSFPQAVGYVQQRLAFAGSNAKPQGVLMSRTADFRNFTTRVPLEDDDALEFTVAGQRANRIRHLLDIKQLLILTGGNELLARGDNDGVIRPTAINIDPVGYIGSSDAPPLLVSGGVIYPQARGSQVIELRNGQNGIESNDLTTWSSHLVDGYQIVDCAWAQSPHSAAWFPRSDGKLLQLTYIPQQDVAAWARHDTRNEDSAGAEVLASITALTVIPEGNEDVLYIVAQRTVNGGTVRYIERLAERRSGLFTSTNDTHATFLDSYVAYTAAANGTATPSVAHLIGRTVYGLRDGVKIGPLTVSGGGTVTVTANWSTLVLGIPISADVELFAVDDANAKDSVVDRLMSVPAIDMLVEQSRGMQAGPDFSNLLTYEMPITNNGATALHTGVADIVIKGDWRVGGTLCIREADPVPFTLLGVVPTVEIGGRQTGVSR